MEAEEFDELALFRAIEGAGIRCVLIGRRALVMLGLGVLTGDYDLWIDANDAERLNLGLASLQLHPTRSPEDARKVGRYSLEGEARIDVLLARAVSTVDGVPVRFDDVWNRRETLPLADGVSVAIPSLDDLIATKRFAARPKDADDIRLLTLLKETRR